MCFFLFYFSEFSHRLESLAVNSSQPSWCQQGFIWRPVRPSFGRVNLCLDGCLIVCTGPSHPPKIYHLRPGLLSLHNVDSSLDCPHRRRSMAILGHAGPGWWERLSFSLFYIMLISFIYCGFLSYILCNAVL